MTEITTDTAMAQAFSDAAVAALTDSDNGHVEYADLRRTEQADDTLSEERPVAEETQPEQESAPAQDEVDTVLDKVEDRIKHPGRRQPRRPEVASDAKLNALADQFKKPAKGRAALFELPADRPASQLLKNIFDSASIEGVDGVDHINIHNNAATELGKFLDMNSYSPFVHPDAGNFQSVGGLWHYIQTRPLMEEYRILSGARVRAMAKKMKDEARDNPDAPRHTPIKGFRTIISDAMWHKVTQNASVLRMMAESTLPFEHYFCQGDLGIRQYPSEGYWIRAAYEEIRRVIKHRLATGDTDAQPDFSAIENMSDDRSPAPARNNHWRDSSYGNRNRTARR